MLSPAVSGSQGYKELATAAKAEERRLAALKQRQRYSKVPGNNNPTPTPPSTPTGNQSTSRNLGKNAPSGLSSGKDTRKCYNCGETRHIASKCPRTKRESTGTPVKPAGTKQVHSRGKTQEKRPTEDPESFLLSSSEEEDDPGVKMVRVTDHGSVTQCVKVLIQGVPAYGLIDSGADITTIGDSLFKKVAAVARLKKKNFRRQIGCLEPTTSSPFDWMDGWTWTLPLETNR